MKSCAMWNKQKLRTQTQCKRWRYSHFRTWRPTGDVDARVHFYTATALSSADFTSGKDLVLILQRLSGPQCQSGHEGVKKNLHPLRHPGSNPGRPASGKAPCHLSYLNRHKHAVLFEFSKKITTLRLTVRSYNWRIQLYTEPLNVSLLLFPF